MKNVRKVIEEGWENRELLKNPELITAVEVVIELLDKGKLRVSQQADNQWIYSSPIWIELD